MLFVPTVIRLGPIRESKMQAEMENKIKDVLCEMLQDIKIHKIDDDNMIFEIDYDKYVLRFKQLLES
jgi:hemerythrin